MPVSWWIALETVELIVRLKPVLTFGVPVTEFGRDDWNTANKIVERPRSWKNALTACGLIFGPHLHCWIFGSSTHLFYPGTNKSVIWTEEKYSAASVSAESFRREKPKSKGSYGSKYAFYSFSREGPVNGFRFDSVHPVVLAEKYHRPYRVLTFLGPAGAASLQSIFWSTAEFCHDRE